MQESQWSKLSSIAEIISSIAIVITLVYLAIQTSQNTSAIQASSRQESLNNELWYLEIQINNPWMIHRPGEDKNLNNDQIKQLNNMFIALFRMRENLFFQYKNGVIDKESWESYQTTFVGFLKNYPSMRHVWDSISSSFNKEFVDTINNEIK